MFMPIGYLQLILLPYYRVNFVWKIEYFLFAKATLDIQVTYKPSSHPLIRIKVWRYMHIIIA